MHPARNLGNEVGHAILKELSKVSVYDLEKYGRKNAPTLQVARESGVIADQAVEMVLAYSAAWEARKEYREMVDLRKAPDKYMRPDLLAYAFENHLFTQEEIAKIPFDWGETPKYYTERHDSSTFTKKLKDELYNPSPKQPWDPHWSECCPSC